MKMRDKKLKIGIDVDEVLADLVVELNRFYNLIYRANFKIQDYKTYDLEKTWGGDKKRAVEIVNAFYYSPFFRDILPVEGSQRIVNLLSDNHALVAITSRPNSIKKETEEWIEKYFPSQIGKIICTGQYGLEQSKISKLESCKSEGVEVIIEDNLETAIQCCDNGINAILFDKPWNRNGLIKDDGIIRVKNWDEVFGVLN